MNVLRFRIVWCFFVIRFRLWIFGRIITEVTLCPWRLISGVVVSLSITSDIHLDCGEGGVHHCCDRFPFVLISIWGESSEDYLNILSPLNFLPTNCNILWWFLPKLFITMMVNKCNFQTPPYNSLLIYLFEFHHKEELFLSSIYLFVLIKLYLRGLVDFYFMQWVVIHFYHYLFWFLNCPKSGQWEPLQAASVSFWHFPFIP